MNDRTMDFQIEEWLVFFSLAGFVGFFADRTSICTVKAIEEVLTTRRAFILISFAKTILWVTGVTIWLAWWIGVPRSAPISSGIAWSGIFGGLLFGIGAVFNGGCAFSTLIRLGNGNLGMLVTLSGFVVGATIVELAKFRVDGIGIDPVAPLFEMNFVMATIFGSFITIWMAWEFVRLWRTASIHRPGALLLSPKFRLSTGAAVIGVSNGILYTYIGTWSYTHTLRVSVEQQIITADAGSSQASAAMLWWLFLALIAGVVVSSVLRRRFVFDRRNLTGPPRFLLGGVLMGLGAAFVPGGNDVLLLNAIPGLSPHALPAYLSMLAGIAIALMVVRWRVGKLDVIDCTGDQCQE